MYGSAEHFPNVVLQLVAYTEEWVLVAAGV